MAGQPRKREGKRCGAYARTTGQPCKRLALPSGKCPNHGGLSTGPKTPEGKARSYAARDAGRAKRWERIRAEKAAKAQLYAD